MEDRIGIAMTDGNSDSDGAKSPPSKTVILKPRGEKLTVRQSFSNGRTKPVLVEVS